MKEERARSLSRRSALAKGVQFAAVAGAPWLLAGSASADSASKAPQTAVQYQTAPNDGRKCADCGRFRAPDGCALVQSPISPAGWCRLFVKKAE